MPGNLVSRMALSPCCLQPAALSTSTAAAPCIRKVNAFIVVPRMASAGGAWPGARRQLARRVAQSATRRRMIGRHALVEGPRRHAGLDLVVPHAVVGLGP